MKQVVLSESDYQIWQHNVFQNKKIADIYFLNFVDEAL